MYGFDKTSERPRTPRTPRSPTMEHHKGRPSNSPKERHRNRRRSRHAKKEDPRINQPCFPNAPTLDEHIFAYILQYIDPYDLTRTIGHVNKCWLTKSRARCSMDVWKLVILTRERSPLAVANNCRWLKNSGILNYIKDLNIAMRIGLDQMRILASTSPIFVNLASICRRTTSIQSRWRNTLFSY